MFKLPDWFNDWGRRHPWPERKINNLVLLTGALGSVVVAVVVGFAWGWPWPTLSTQTGPRGIGMAVIQAETALEDVEARNEDYYTEPPWLPEGGEQLASEAYENVQVLGELTVDNFNRLMSAMTQWVAPDQGCAYCHNLDEGFAPDTLYTKVVSRRMLEMTRWINANWDAHVAPSGVNCYTCHRGQNVPSGVWFRLTPVVEAFEGWAEVQNVPTPQTVMTSLPSDALESFLLEQKSIKVHDLEALAPSVQGAPTWQDTERTYSLMNYFSDSLGVNCTFCHNTRALFDPGQVTPAWAGALLGIDMLRDINGVYLAPLVDLLPPSRLGPLHGDAPKAACRTCHKGVNKPLLGQEMVTDWPELMVTEGAPVYD